ncbi:MAG: zinc-binding dehydrogenase [Hyphomicrobiales bacterium]
MSHLRCVVTGPRRVVLAEDTLPSFVPPGGLRIRTIYSLISPGTELAMYNGTHIGIGDPSISFAKYPFHPGYAAVGEVVETGEGVVGFTPGDRVFFAGGHASEAMVPATSASLAAVPRGLDLRIAPFARLAQIAYTAPFVAGEAAGKDVAVIGLGLVGNLAAQLFRRAGARVFAFDTLPARRDWARLCGIEHAFTVDGDTVENIRRAMGDAKPTIVVEATGSAALVPPCLRLVADRGTVVLLGSPRQTVELDVYSLIHRTGAHLVGAHERVIPDAAANATDKRKVTGAMLEALGAGGLEVRPLLSRMAAPSEIADCYQALDAEKDKLIGVLLRWSDD